MPAYLPILLLFCSNIFMTTAWYWHLKYMSLPTWQVILISWGLALFEYSLAVPANRLGARFYTPAQLKTIQEVITLIVFSGFAVLYLKERLTVMTGVGFSLIALGAAVVFLGKA